MTSNETVVLQKWAPDADSVCRWTDFGRDTEETVRAFIAKNAPLVWRGVDWIDKSTIVVPPRTVENLHRTTEERRAKSGNGLVDPSGLKIVSVSHITGPRSTMPDHEEAECPGKGCPVWDDFHRLATKPRTPNHMETYALGANEQMQLALALRLAREVATAAARNAGNPWRGDGGPVDMSNYALLDADTVRSFESVFALPGAVRIVKDIED